MIPNPDWNYPKLYAELSAYEKEAMAAELFRQYNEPPIMSKTFLHDSYRIMDICQNDFKLSSLLAYKIVADWFADEKAQFHSCRLFKENSIFLPVRYCGGDMCFGRVFAINHCAFSSADSIIGFRNSETDRSQEYFKIAKGLRYIGVHKNWTLFKLDKSSTDDMTGIIYSPLEKNFTIESAHFPYDSAERILFRWTDC